MKASARHYLAEAFVGKNLFNVSPLGALVIRETTIMAMVEQPIIPTTGIISYSSPPRGKIKVYSGLLANPD